MAVDTATKRYAMVNFGNGDALYPVPDGTIAAVDRHHFLGLYQETTSSSGVSVRRMRMAAILKARKRRTHR